MPAVARTGNRDLDRVLKDLEKLPRNLRKRQPMFKKVSVEMSRWSDRNFKSEGGEVGGWKQLKPIKFRGEIYAGSRIKGKGKRRRVTKAKILRDTGRGQGSVKTQSTRNFAKIFTRLPYMIAHHEGTARLPLRQVIPVEKNVVKQAVAAAVWHLEKAIKDSGL
jgi:phage gpG-like protein